MRLLTVDVSESEIAKDSKSLLQILLKDRTTKRNIVWASPSYKGWGKDFTENQTIKLKSIIGPYESIIQPRVAKRKTDQAMRTRKRGEVFTPSWLVDKQIKLVEDELGELVFEKYICLRWIEIACGEGPYIVTRYDSVTGDIIPVENRVGFLDRKLQRILQETKTEKEFVKWARVAYQSTYGYELQGDSLLLARENLLLTFYEYYAHAFERKPELKTVNQIANIISYNLFQMNGLTLQIPYSSEKKGIQLDLFNDEGVENIRSLAAVRKAISEHEKTITLSVGQLTTGVTVPEWSGVIMLCNMKSPAQYMQAAFRAQNPYRWTDSSTGKHYKKERAYVFDFAPERTLAIYDQFANDLSIATARGRGTSYDREKNIGALLNFFPVIAEDSQGRMIEIDAQAVMTIPKQIKAQEVVKRGFMSNLLFDNIAGIFRATQTVLDILGEFPTAEQGKVTHSEAPIETHDVKLDDDDNPIIPTEIIVSTNERLFGDGVRESADVIGESVRSATVKPSFEEMINQVATPVITPIVTEMQATYGLKSRDSKRIEDDIKATIRQVAQHNDSEQKIKEAHINNEYNEKIKAVQDIKVKELLKQEQEERLEAVADEYKEKFATDISDAIKELPKALIEQQEVAEARALMNEDEEKIRGHLRGFARTIPSFLMAYGDEKLTLDNFDTYVDEKVFHEVTGISLEQFRYLRDGGQDFTGHLFDSATFNEAIQEFLRKKAELANYFEDNKEDIFDYIPPQQTNQIFTPRWVVRKMVDELEKENPHIFEDDKKTFIDLYMKSGLYIAEIVRRLFNNPVMKTKYPDDSNRLRHILEQQVYGFAPSEIIYRIATNFIFGPVKDSVKQDHFVQEDTIPYAKEGRIQKLIDLSWS